MILDNVNNYDLSTFMGLNLSSFKTDTLYFVSALLLFSLITIYIVAQSESNKAKQKNQKKEQLSAIEKERYQSEGMEMFWSLNDEDYEIKSLYKNAYGVSVIIESCINSKSTPDYLSGVSGDMLNTLFIYKRNKDSLLNLLCRGHVINKENPAFKEYKKSLLEVYDAYELLLNKKMNNNPQSLIIDINNI